MLDPLSFAAVGATIQAVGSGAATEAGKQAWEALGTLTRRLLGRDVPAPSGRAEREALAGRLVAAAADDPAYARELARWLHTAPEPVRPSRTSRSSRPFRPSPAGSAASAGSVGPPPADAPTPHLLPATTRHFTDRAKVFKEIDAEADRTGFGAKSVLLYGPEGAGSTAVAAHYGEYRRTRFPDGQLYEDLRGASAATADAGRPSRVLAGFLARLGVPEEQLPATAEDRAALYRELVADRRLLVVLDHVRTAAEAQLFRTDAPGVLTLYAGHGRLSGLEARPVAVEPLSRRDSEKLLVSIVGNSATRAERSLLRAAARRYAGSPLALTAFGRRMAADPRAAGSLLEAADGPAPAGAPAGAQAGVHPDDLGDDLAGVDPVRDVTELSYRALSAPAARLYRLLSPRPWPDIDVPAAAAAVDLSEAEVRPLITELAATELLTTHDADAETGGAEGAESGQGAGHDGAHDSDRDREYGHGGEYDRVRHRFRPYAREHAEQAAAAEEGPGGCSAAVRRMTDRLLRLAVAADYRALPARWRLGPLYRPYEDIPVGPEEGRRALGVLRAESRNLVEAVRAAHAYGDHDTVLQLCEALWALLLKAGREEELLPALRIGSEVASANCPYSRMAGRMHTQLAYALGSLQRFAEAEEAQRSAAAAERAAGHKRGHATALEALGVLRLRQWRYAAAEEPLRAATAVLDGIAADEEGAGDVPRARAILAYHLARVRRGQAGQTEQAEQIGQAGQAGLAEREAALGEFAASRRLFRELTPPDRFNEAKALTGLAGTHLDSGRPDLAVGALDEALTALEPAEQAPLLHADIAHMRDRCAREVARESADETDGDTERP